jgi:hypothetical protein
MLDRVIFGVSCVGKMDMKMQRRKGEALGFVGALLIDGQIQ